MVGAVDPTVDLDECQALVWRLSVLTGPQPDTETARFDPPDARDTLEELDTWPPPVDGGARSRRPPPHSGRSSRRPRPSTAVDADSAGDVATELAAAALYRQSMGVLEPTDAQIERMVQRAAAWDDAVAGPQRLTAINAMAMDFYADRVDTAWAGPYLDERLPGWRTHPHVSAGYAPAGWTTLVDHLGGRGVTDDELLEAGLATRASTGALIDRFRDRVVLPITHDDQILGFVGRRHPDLTDDDEPPDRSTSTPPTPSCSTRAPSSTASSPDLLEHGATPVLVEGPIDALAVTLAGNGRYVGVAPLGTALTDEQARQLATLSTSPIVATDADLAGRVAAERDFWLLAQHGTDPRTAELPAGTDPASILTVAGPATLRDHLDSAQPLGPALLDDLLNRGSGRHGGPGRRAHRRPAPTGLASTGKPGQPAAGHRRHAAHPPTGCAGPNMERRPRACRRQQHRTNSPSSPPPPKRPRQLHGCRSPTASTRD